MVQVYNYVIFRNKIGIPTREFGWRSPVIQKKTPAEMCYLNIAERVQISTEPTSRLT